MPFRRYLSFGLVYGDAGGAMRSLSFGLYDMVDKCCDKIDLSSTELNSKFVYVKRKTYHMKCGKSL